MRERSLPNRLADLFRGRSDAYGLVEGRCVRAALTPELWYGHCYGDGSIGVYPLMGDGNVWWFGTDIDTGFDDLAAARNMCRALKVLGIRSFCEISKSKGFHVLVFCAEPIEAKTARACMQVAHKLAKVAPKEIYPKQDVLTEDKPLGNYLNVPYAHQWATRSRRVVLASADSTDVLTLEEFVTQAEQARVTRDVVAAAAALWTPPRPPVTVVCEERDDSEIRDLVKHLTPLGKHMLKEGPLVDAVKGKPDRSTFLVRLARECKVSGLTPNEAASVVHWADSGLASPKFALRADGPKRVAELVVEAWR